MPYSDPQKERAFQARHYQEHKDLYKARAAESSKKLRKERQEYVRTVKNETPCADCQVSYPYWVMDFDHLHDKEHKISLMVSGYSMKKLKAEIDKCEIVCANCHRDRTHARLVESADTDGLNPSA